MAKAKEGSAREERSERATKGKGYAAFEKREDKKSGKKK